MASSNSEDLVLSFVQRRRALCRLTPDIGELTDDEKRAKDAPIGTSGWPDPRHSVERLLRFHRTGRL